MFSNVLVVVLFLIILCRFLKVSGGFRWLGLVEVVVVVAVFECPSGPGSWRLGVSKHENSQQR